MENFLNLNLLFLLNFVYVDVDKRKGRDKLNRHTYTEEKHSSFIMIDMDMAYKTYFLRNEKH